MKKTLSLLFLFFIILNISSNVFATELHTQLDIIQKSAETKYLENDQGYISKSIINSDKDKGELQLN